MLTDLHLVLCGAGAVGSLLADALARQGARRLRVIDRDRVEPHNVATQLYGLDDVGGRKAEVLRHRLFRAAGVEIEATAKELTDRTARPLLRAAGLVIDAFDNAAARRLVQEHCRALGRPCLHVGLFADYAEVIWDEAYRVPADVGGDVCAAPLARPLVLLAVAVAADAVGRFAATGERVSRTATLADFAVRELEAVIFGPASP